MTQTISAVERFGDDRLVALCGTVNCRDIGGYMTPDGPIAWRRLLRSDALDGLDVASREQLAQMGLRTVVDLRRDAERADRPNALEGLDLRIHQVAVISGAMPIEQVVVPPLDEVYSQMVANAGPALATAVGALAEPGALPALVHCSAGKDRTGVVVGLVLSLLGVDDEVIATDYAASAELVRGRTTLLERAMGPDTDEVRRAALEGLLESPPNLIRDTFTNIRDQYGDIASYLVHHGMDPSAPDRLRQALLG